MENFKHWDKVLHFCVAVVMAKFFLAIGFSIIGAFMASFIVCVLKEVIWDGLMERGNPDFNDLLAGMAGALVGVLL